MVDPPAAPGKARARRYRVRRGEPLVLAPRDAAAAGPDAARPLRPGAGGPAAPLLPDPEAPVDPLEAVSAEGLTERLTGRQLRMARRVAQRHGLAAASDHDAVRQLRARGIDPFRQSSLLDLVGAGPGGPAGAAPTGSALVARTGTLPQRAPQGARRGIPQAPPAATGRAAEIRQIQRDIRGRRRRRSLLLAARLLVFVALPTLLAGYYYAALATPMFATRSEFVIQQAEAAGAAAGLGGLFQGTAMATQQDSMTVQAYLTSRDAYRRLDGDHGFRAAFSDPAVDPVQRLLPDATEEAAYAVYQDHVKISYDPTEGIVKMEVIAPDPLVSQVFSEALIGYAEERVDQLTRRVREDQMAGARQSYEDAEGRREAALEEWLRIQTEVRQIDPVGETAARTAQISALETERQRLQLQLASRLAMPRPNGAQVAAIESGIGNVEALIADLRADMTQATGGTDSLAASNTELRLAEENYAFQTAMVQQALAQMEAARIEANRQVRYLSLGVEPVAPDQATYPRVFENTALAFLVCAGLYLMVSLTASILREQVAN